MACVCPGSCPLLPEITPNHFTCRRLVAEIIPNHFTCRRLVAEITPNHFTCRRLVAEMIPNHFTCRRLVAEIGELQRSVHEAGEHKEHMQRMLSEMHAEMQRLASQALVPMASVQGGPGGTAMVGGGMGKVAGAGRHCNGGWGCGRGCWGRAPP